MTSHNSKLRQTRQDTSLKRKPSSKATHDIPHILTPRKSEAKANTLQKKARSQTDSNLGPSGYEPNSASPNLHTMKRRLTYDWNTRGFSTRPAQSCCSIRHRNLLSIFSSFHFLAKNSLTLTPSGTECFAHVFLCWMYLFPRRFGRAV